MHYKTKIKSTLFQFAALCAHCYFKEITGIDSETWYQLHCGMETRLKYVGGGGK